MALVNEHFLKLPGSYLFSDIAKKINTFRITHPKQDVIRLGIGDVTRPLPQACIQAMHKAVDEMADAKTFHGYGPEQGYDFLIDAVIKHDYAPRGIHFSPQEIFINDGAKAIRETSATSSAMTTVWGSPIPSIPYILTAT